mmetsp:Transcript_14441/g.36135  ORF Transcript_14441/g.36135 Transcript_14441/m.36135 type:complete len:105 (+) Transcript_14441:3708-4022(+)
MGHQGRVQLHSTKYTPPKMKSIGCCVSTLLNDVQNFANQAHIFFQKNKLQLEQFIASPKDTKDCTGYGSFRSRRHPVNEKNRWKRKIAKEAQKKAEKKTTSKSP